MPDPTPPAAAPKLKPANENPWYCLMTLHGEQPEHAWHFGVAKDLHIQNRRDWNKWAARALTEEQRATLLEQKNSAGRRRFEPEELTPHNEAEWAQFVTKFQNRAKTNKSKTPPDPSQIVWCSYLLFERFVMLSDFIFSDSVLLDGSTFLSGANFSSVMFLRFTDFSGAKFAYAAEFCDTNFLDVADFEMTNYTGDAIFNGASFSLHAKFNGATFSGTTNLEGASFLGTANFSGAKFSRKRIASFENANFGGTTSFLNAELEGDTSFARAVFKNHPPSFHGAKLTDGVALHGVKWPNAPADITVAQQHVYNYQRLKQMMETLKKHEDELDFFAREMACKRALHRANGEIGKAWLLGLYERMSDYGRSAARPTKYLAISLVYTAFIMAAILRWRIPEGYPVLASVGEALNLTYANLLSPLNIRKDFYSADALQNLPHAIKAISAFQTVAGVFFTFLIGLALRNRFRMK